MGAFTTEAKNYMLDQRLGTGASSGTYAALCNGAPTDFADAKTKELTGGSPAYARIQANLNAAATSAKTLAANLVFNIPAGSAFSHLAWWRNATAGAGIASEYVTSTALSAAEGAYGSQGTYTVTAETFSITD